MAHPGWESMMGIAQKVSRNFSDAVRARGQSYFVKGRVSLMASRPGEVVARVRGTAKYRVRVRLRGSKVLTSCTCPYFNPQGEPCKHIWATLLLADSRNLLQAPPVFPLRLVVEGPRRPASPGIADLIGETSAGSGPATGQQPPYSFDSELGIIGLGPQRPGPPPRGAAGTGRGPGTATCAASRSATRAPGGRVACRRATCRRATVVPSSRRPARSRPPGPAPGARQAGQGRQPQRQAAAGLRARRGRHAVAEPGRHRPGPPPAQDHRRMGPAAALVLRAPCRAREV